jgi:nucleotide-binding universal stress UspA family protein
LRIGSPAEQILSVSDEVAADLIVMGTHGRTGLHRQAMGGTAEVVTRRSRRPVVTVHAPSQDEIAAA